MNIVGLNKLAAAPPQPRGQGTATSKEGKSFEDVLGQSQTETKESKAPARPLAKEDRSQPKAQNATEKKEATPSALPTQPNTPVLDKPVITERLMPAPNEVPMVNPMTKPVVSSVKDDESVDALTRRAVWSSFLKKMKDELGVSAEDVLGAFDSLSAEDLAKPPQQTVDKVVMALGLEPQQTQQAKQYFMELIDRTQARSIGEELSHSEKQISLTLMSQREVERKNQNKAIDNLNQNFFMKGPFERPPAAPQATPRMEAPAPLTDANKLDTPFVVPNEGASPSASSQTGFALPKELQAPVAKSAAPAPKVDIDALIKRFTEGQGQSEQVTAQHASATKTALNPQMIMPAVPQLQTASSAESGVTAARTATTSGAEAMAAINAIFGQGANNQNTDAELTDDQRFTQDASYLSPSLGADGQSLVQGQPSEFQQQLSSAAPNQPMAVPDLVKNAQVMVQDGGGEMKVTLTPEGLGEVAMKVSVKDGKVNVQMITESDEAKRMIERSLGDLKSQLAQNQLQVTDIKIDTASNLGKQLEQQYNDAQRQMAQQTLEQFRQDHQGWRRSHFEVPGAKVYKNQADAPRDVQAPTSVGSRNRGGSRRLDLVA